MRTYLLAVVAVAIGAFPVFAQDALRPAKISEVTVQGAEVTRTFFGRVAARETVDIAFQVGGQITDFPVIEGEPIGEADIIAQLDLEPFQLALDQARVQKDQADRTVERLKQLQGNAVSQVSVDDAQTQADLAAISVRDAERSLRNATLRAPFTALVATRNVANFSTVQAGTPIARIHDMSELHIEIDVPEVLFQRAGRDPDVELWAEFPASDEQFPLEVREFNAETSQVGQTFRITLGLAPPENLVVLPGASVTVYATLKGGPSQILVPASAIVPQNDGSAAVMVFTPDGEAEGTVRLTAVEVSPTIQGRVSLTAGIEPGQEIVVSGAAMLEDGARVRRFTGFPK